MRRAARVDANHTQIATGLRRLGAWVWSTASQGNGFPDLLVWYRGGYHLLEVKPPGAPSKAKLTDREAVFHRSCPGPVHVVRSLEEAAQAIGMGTRIANETAGE